jgi:hypothetical protein
MVWALPQALFALVVLEIGSFFLPRQTWTLILLLCTFCSSCDDRTIPQYPVIGWEGVLPTFCLGWPWAVFLPISASKLLRLQAWATITWLNPNFRRCFIQCLIFLPLSVSVYLHQLILGYKVSGGKYLFGKSTDTVINKEYYWQSPH